MRLKHIIFQLTAFPTDTSNQGLNIDEERLLGSRYKRKYTKTQDEAQCHLSLHKSEK